MNQAPNVPFVEQPRAHAATAQRAHATQISAALLKRVEHIGRIIVADDADQSWPGTPERRTERTVQKRPARLPHPSCTVGENHIVDEQIAQQNDSRCHWS